ncbi:hypothetical protein MAPG_03115 [Magnaporthiopsis poae ATCC 64411]|uniref:Uncharacterized protein n=1 Tax=Magnaporthiopsis poae (strain ATCC 64411 / 73-15) TaxID=644358 RepID=A0A0C4DT58_MAGP6|nr:hypothetical protein MAPG_03115 [Magnaporthiopsis poae ATCC 64411]
MINGGDKGEKGSHESHEAGREIPGAKGRSLQDRSNGTEVSAMEITGFTKIMPEYARALGKRGLSRNARDRHGLSQRDRKKAFR